MNTYVISLYSKFHCLGGKCPHSCCKGWQIPVDDSTYEEYKKMRGAYGRALRFHVRKMLGMHMIKKQFGKCPHLNCDNMCQLQANGELNLMPMICRVYPRDAVAAGGETEVTMELSCISMAKTFLENPGRLFFLPFDKEIESLWIQENDDEPFYSYLKYDRNYILDYLWDDAPPLDEAFEVLYAYVYKQHDLIMRDRIDEAKGVELMRTAEEMGMYHLNRKPTYAFFSMKTIDRMIITHINYGALWLRERRFFHLIRRYLKIFSDMYVEDANVFFDTKVRRMMAAGYEAKYRSYFSYCIQQLYTKAYETYFILRQLMFSILYVQLLMIFDLVDYLDRGERCADIDRQSEILMLCEQSIRHNPDMTKNLLEIIRQEFL